MTTVAVTGASGFIGRRLLPALQGAGYDVRALVRRRPMNARDDVRWIVGDLSNAHALAALIDGADVVIHGAGLVKALSSLAFHAVNAQGTAALADLAAAQATPPRFIHISSFAAREPRVSAYAASKAAAEAAVLRHAPRMPVVVLRPPAVYGPGDREALRVLQMAARGFVLAPRVPGGRLSLVHVDDAVAAILAALRLNAPPDAPVEFDDGRPGGYGWADIASVAADVLGRPVRLIEVPAAALYAGGAVATLTAQLLRRPSVLSWDKVGEGLHPDWVAATPPLTGYQPRWNLPDGFKNTAEWADSQGLLRLLRRS